MGESTTQQVMDIRAALSHALGAAETALAAARDAHVVAGERRGRAGGGALPPRWRPRRAAAAREVVAFKIANIMTPNAHSAQRQ